ncbi:hypothetical protein TRVL_07273 [Trypanosoma vivax]|nr:hypothetical protein TRVL_07273 [Trypanosoma vivax]
MHWNATFDLLMKVNNESNEIYNHLTATILRETYISGTNATKCRLQRWRLFSQGVSNVYAMFGYKEKKAFRHYGVDGTQFAEEVTSCVYRMHALVRRAKRCRGCVPLYRQLLDMFRTW